ncbi:MAG TPA: hypothetical protein VHT53_00745 [Candidatus Elarobacter sp.]|jgi:prophage DNA circulation protein|nr:hypothetical protein [Candidatus Elarobacter sp.]
MPTLTTDQIQKLADSWTDYAAALSDYQNDHTADPDVDQAALGAAITDAALKGNNFSQQVLVASFDDAAKALQQIDDAIGQAKKALSDLQNEAQSWNRAAAVIGAMADLAGSLPGSPFAILKATHGVVTAASPA